MLRTSIAAPSTALAIFVTILFISGGTGLDGPSVISNFMA